MRKLIILLVERPESIRISLDTKPVKNVRSLKPTVIESCYLRMLSGIQTVVTKEQGDINMYVSNITTGESWSYSFDSIMEPQSFIQLSGNPGYYEVEYVTESGDIYYGVFIIE